MAVVSDRKIVTPETTNTSIAYNETNIKAYNDYYPYGMLLDNRNDSKEIIIQDINNSLYLISNRGKVLWKKQLNYEYLRHWSGKDRPTFISTFCKNGKLCNRC